MSGKFKWDIEKYFLRNILRKKKDEKDEIKKQEPYYNAIIENINNKIEQERKELEENQELKDFLK